MHYILINLNTCKMFQCEIIFFLCAWDIFLVVGYWKQETYEQAQNWLYWYCWITLVCVWTGTQKSRSLITLSLVNISNYNIYNNDCCLYKLNIFRTLLVKFSKLGQMFSCTVENFSANNFEINLDVILFFSLAGVCL